MLISTNSEFIDELIELSQTMEFSSVQEPTEYMKNNEHFTPQQWLILASIYYFTNKLTDFVDNVNFKTIVISVVTDFTSNNETTEFPTISSICKLDNNDDFSVFISDMDIYKQLYCISLFEQEVESLLKSAMSSNRTFYGFNNMSFF